MSAVVDGLVILLAVLGLGFVIAVHELGHFLFAKWAGVRVHIFAIGFGKPLWSRRIGGTDYQLGMLPFGGYVAMQEEDDGTEGPGKPFTQVSAAWRAAILLAGVTFNLISSFLILLGLAWSGMSVNPPVVGEVWPRVQDLDGWTQSPAQQLGLRSGDRILELSGQRMRSLTDLQLALIVADRERDLTVLVRRDGEELRLPPAGAESVHIAIHPESGRRDLGISVALGRKIVGVRPGTLGVEPGWELIGAAGESFDGQIGQQISETLLPRVGERIEFRLRQGSEERVVTAPFAGIVDWRDAGDSTEDLALGLPVRIIAVIAGMPAEAAGVLPGDLIMAVDGVAVASDLHFRALVRRAARVGQPVELSIDRAGELLTKTMSAAPDPASGQPLIGVAMASVRSGRLQRLPPALGSETSPLATAGIEPDDVLLGRRAVGDQVEVTIVRGGELQALPFSEAVADAMLAGYNPRALSKMFGARSRPPLGLRLAGTQVVAIDSAELMVARPPVLVSEARPELDRIDLATLDPAVRTLLGRLAVGDWIAGVDGVEVDGRRAIEVVRGAGADALRSVLVQPASPGLTIALGPAEEVLELASWTEAFVVAWDKTGEILDKTFKIIPSFFRPVADGGVDHSRQLQGPIGIFSELKARAQHGLGSFLFLLALLGINLVLVNLLPIPIADGGRLVVLLIETIARRPLPPRVTDIINSVGLAMIVLLMLYVVGLDLLRQFGLH